MYLNWKYFNLHASFPNCLIYSTGFASFSPNQDPSLQYAQFSPKSLIEGAITNTVETPSHSNTVAKPKKFFKSRNSVPDANAIVAALSDSQVAAAVIGSPSNVASYYSSATIGTHHQQQTSVHPYSEKTRRKKTTKSVDSAKKSKAEKTAKAEKPPKPEKLPKPEKQPKPEKPPKPEKIPKAVKKKSKAIEKTVETPKPTRVFHFFLILKEL